MNASRTRALRLPLAALVCSVVLVSGCSDSGSSDSGSSGRKKTSTAQAAQAVAPAADGDLQSSYQKVIRGVLPSVVQIQASNDLGSGVVYDDKGHIVTNAHVVGDEKTFKVTTANNENELTATLVYSYPEQDLAVIKLDKVPDGLRAASFGDTAKVQVGQIVLAMGSPLGLSSSVTQGIVSATGRTVSEGAATARPERPSPTWCRPPRPSTRATAVARSSTWTARSSASPRSPRSTPTWGTARRPGSGSPSPRRW